jgi:hypothetical protein
VWGYASRIRLSGYGTQWRAPVDTVINFKVIYVYSRKSSTSWSAPEESQGRMTCMATDLTIRWWGSVYIFVVCGKELRGIHTKPNFLLHTPNPTEYALFVCRWNNMKIQYSLVDTCTDGQHIESQARLIFTLSTCKYCQVGRGFWNWILDLLTTYTHNSLSTSNFKSLTELHTPNITVPTHT